MKKKNILLLGTGLLGLLALASCGKNANNEKNDINELNDQNVVNDVDNSCHDETHVVKSEKNNDRLSSKDNLDYISSKYGIENHVFDVITIDRLNLLLDKTKTGQYGDSVIVFANANNEISKKALEKINEEALKLGIKRIYYFDLILAGEYGVNLWDNPELTWPNIKTNDGKETQVTQAFIQSRDYLLENTSLANVNENYDANHDVYLFVNRHQEGTSEILKDLLIENNEGINETKIDEVLNTVIDSNGNFIGTNYSDYDYFNNAIYRSATTNSYYESYDEFKDKFYVRSITYYELRLLLETEGKHNILFSGSWCGDSKAAIALVVEDAAKYGNEEPVYVFDFRLTNGVKSSNQTSIVEAEGKQSELVNGNASRNFITGVGYLGEEVIEKLGEFEVGTQNTKLSYLDGGYSNFNINNNAITPSYKISTQKKFRSPSLFKYDGTEGKVVDSWLHVVDEKDIPHASSTYQVGDLIDYELSSGTLSEQQKAYGRYSLAVFLGAPEVSYTAPKINVSETASDLDSGCGDDNDPIDNLNQDALIPNHGTDSYDVSKYDIEIELIEGTLPKNAKFVGKTTISAVANKELNNQIVIDFRRQVIKSISLTNKTTGETLLNNISGNDLNSYITRVNNDDEDLQKLYIKNFGIINANDEFELVVEYETTTIDNSTTNSEYGQFAEGFNLHYDTKGYSAIGEPFGPTYWYPNNNTPADGAKYTIKLIAPSEYTLISNGVRLSNAINSETGKRETVWEVTQDTASYQIFATFSKNIVSFEQATGTRSQSFYETADGRKIPVYIYVNADIYKENRYKVDRFIGLLPHYIKTLEEKFGPYRGESLGFIFENVGDGHGESASWGAIETKDRPFFTNRALTGENTFVHEFVHQWFGDAVRINDWDNLWLNEGFATYGASLYYELTDDKYNAIDTYKELYNSKGENSKLWQIAPANLPNESDLFGGQKSAYNRGALALAVLRDGIGDEAFFNVLQTWLDNNSGEAKTTADFIALVKTIVPDKANEIDQFNNVWLYGTTKPSKFSLTGE